MDKEAEGKQTKRGPWWKSIGPALITACVVFGPGSLLISSNVGAKYGYQMVWLLLLTGLLMGTYLMMGARIGVCGGATPCTLVARRLGRPSAAVIALTLCLIATAFQFSNNLAVALAAGAFFPKPPPLVLENQHLSTSAEDGNDTQLTYSVTKLPANGKLSKDGEVFAESGTFTQDDLDAGKVSYERSSSFVSKDSFEFTIRNAAGGESDTNVFTIGAPASEHAAGQGGAPADSDLPLIRNCSATLSKTTAQKIVPWIVIAFNGVVVLFLFQARSVYSILERGMKVMVGVILVCFVFNLVAARPDVVEVVKGFWPSLPDDIKLGLPKEADGAIVDPMILIASLLGTTFSIAGAFFQGNLVRERNWTVKDYEGSVGDAIAGVCVLTGVSVIIMVTAGTVIPGQPATDIGTLALSLKPLLGSIAYWVFCIGLVAVAMNPFLINAMIGGTILADGVGTDARMSDRWPRLLTVIVMLVGMGVALWALSTGEKPIKLIIFGQALTVLGNPLMAVSMLWLANQKDVMGDRRNGWFANTLGGVGLVLVVLMALRVLWRIVLQVT